ncbi:MAG TPA: cation:proton antiporter [Chloroflexota bacterium]|jgi:CPA2 family monovalent cation:H+ antiporter-2
MPHETGLISTIAVALGFALVGGFVATRLRLPALLGYLLAGIAVGPFTPGFIADAHLAPQLAEIGVILLMFGVGIHFSLQDLLAVRAIAVPGAVGQIAVATALAVGLAVWWGWSPGSGLVLGLAVSVASTVVLLRALLDRGQLETAAGRAAVGWLIVEDIFTVLALVLLPAFAPQLGDGSAAGATALSGGELLAELAVTLGKIALLGVLAFVVGTRTVPWFLLQVARTGSQELFTLAVLAIALGVAYGSAVIFGVSFALGAFLAGLVVGESDLSHQAAADALPLRDAFAVLFFVSVGMLFDPSFLLDNPGRVLAVVALVVVGKPLAALVIVLALRHPLRTGLIVAAGLAQIGEFSFILAELGRNLRLLPDEGYNLVLAAALISITVNSLAFRTIEPIERWIERRPRLAALLTRRPPLDATAAPLDAEAPARLRGHAVLCGYGRVGQVVAEALEQHAIPCLVVEQDRGRLEPLRRRGRAVLEGDAADRSTLEQMNLPEARLLIIAIPDPLETRHIVEQARRANPQFPIIARTHSEEEYAYLSDGRVTEAVLGERELARTMSRSALRYLRIPADSTSLQAGGAHAV